MSDIKEPDARPADRSRTVRYLAGFIRLASCLLGVAIAWQAVRFCLGEVGNPLVDVMRAVFGASFTESRDGTAEIFRWTPTFDLLLGIATWLAAAVLVMALGCMLARTLEVGWRQVLIEEREYRAEVRRIAKIEPSRERKLELRRKLASTKKSGFGLGALLIGIVIGRFL
jgi:hypothetical protein